MTRPGFTAVHRASVQGGLLAELTFTASGKKIDCAWGDRLYDRPTTTVYSATLDPDAPIELISDGPLATVVRSRSRFLAWPERPTDSDASVIYDWYYWNDASGEILVAADWSQSFARAWNERHFLEWRNKGQFSDYVGSDGTKPLALDGENHRFDRWAALASGDDSLAMFGEKGQVYDGKTPPETYLHLDPDFSWNGWSEQSDFHTGTLRAGSLGENPVTTLGALTPRTFHTGTLTAPALERQVQTWLDAAVLRLRLDGALDALSADSSDSALAETLKKSNEFFTWESEKLGFLFRRSTHSNADSTTLQGVTLAAIVDKTTRRVLTVSGAFPLFTLENRAPDETLSSVSSKEGWGKIIEQADGNTLALRFVPPTDSPCCAVTVRFKPSENGGAAIDYALDGGNAEQLAPQALRSMAVRLSGNTDAPKFVWPEGAGRMFFDPFAKPFAYHSTYPSGFPATMQWSAFWDETTERGLYSGFHDPNGAQKSLEAKSFPESRAIELSYRVEIPDDLSFPDGAILLEPFDGDWFDAAQIYKKWVRAAIWYPTLDANGRPDTPDWFKSLSLWCLFNYADKDSAIATLHRFQEAFDIPLGVHCYNWHAIPFDNDYPHYFPTKPGFADAVIELQKNDTIHIMPYINGRLWDTHDKGATDWRFTSDALCAATKKRDGSPFTETYHSLEEDGSKVKLAVMCPTTDVWRDKVRENVLRIMNQCGTDAVYIDQIAAAVPVLCMDKSHGHTLNGGCWWVQSYLAMLDRIRTDMRTESNDWPCTEAVSAANQARRDKVKNHVITTECNAESFIKGLDGYLTWHWQYNGAVPAFSAVYGGAIQMFGRSYSGDALAWKMKAAESLVFGEQIGWFGPELLDRAEEFAFIRPLVRFRQSIADYFYRGEMARPPKFLDPVPNVTADWKWSGNPTPVTACAVRTGCWHLTDSSRAIVIFSNTTNEPLQSRVAVALDELGFEPESAVLRFVDSEGNRSNPLENNALEKPLDFPPLTTWGIEISKN